MKQRNEAQRLGIGDGRDEKAENFAQGKGGAKISHKEMCCANFAQWDVLCEFRTRHYSPAQMQNWILSNGHNFFVSNPNHIPFEALDS